jgi:SAM-dependent methyltransferase
MSSNIGQGKLKMELARDAETSRDAYARIAELYDLEHDSYDDDTDFYVNFVEAVGDPVLELGCGSGRLLTGIAEAGYRVTGTDRSEPMLDRARARVEESGLGHLIQLAQGEMGDADESQGGPFGVAIIALNGLLHVADPGAQRKVLSSVRKALDPRGMLLIDVLNPTPETLRSLDHALSHEGVWYMTDGTRVDKFAARRVAAAAQTIATELWYDLTGADGSIRRIATSMPMRYLHRSELELMLELAGFAEWQVYGGYDLEPFGDQSERLIVAAEVTPS